MALSKCKPTMDITECSLCFESFKEPKVLQCIHTFCLQCLESYGKDKNPGDTVACPLCSKVFIIPAGGYKDLPKNYFISQLLELNKLPCIETPDQQLACEICAAVSEVTPASAYCNECGQDLCERCCKRHESQKLLRGHKIVGVEDKPSSAELIKTAPSFCEQHIREEVRYFCHDCKTTECVICCLKKHSKHDFSDITESAEKFHEQLKEDIEKVMTCTAQSQEEIKQIDENQMSLISQIDATEKEIALKYDSLRAMIDQHQSQLMAELAAFREKRLRELETRKEELERQLMIVDGFKRYCQEMQARGTPCEISRSANDLKVSADELVKIQEEYFNTQLTAVEVSFLPSLALKTNLKNWIGQVNFKIVPPPVKIETLNNAGSGSGRRSGAKATRRTTPGKSDSRSLVVSLRSAECDALLKRSIKAEDGDGDSDQLNKRRRFVKDGVQQIDDEDGVHKYEPAPVNVFNRPIIKLFVYPPADNGTVVTNEDLFSLNTGAYLTDHVIDFYLKYIFNELLSDTDRSRTHIFGSSFYTDLNSIISATLGQTLEQTRHSKVRHMTDSVDVFSKDFVIVPIKERLHWFLAIVCFSPSKLGTKNNGVSHDHEMDHSGTATAKTSCILIFDPLKTDTRWDVAAVLRKYLQVEWDVRRSVVDGQRTARDFGKTTMKGNMVKCPKQNNSTDCGTYILHYVEMFYKRPPVSFELPVECLSDWFTPAEVASKRRDMRTLVLEMTRRLNVTLVYDPVPDGCCSDDSEVPMSS